MNDLPENIFDQDKPKYHELKTDPIPFDDMQSGGKKFEIRKDDRQYQVGDILILRKTRRTGREMALGAPLEYIGNPILLKVTHIMHGPCYGLIKGWVIMSITPLKPNR